ncbi:MAG: MobA/MobL family protein, partial [Alphaproteobacteria bacterium]|nr:MobA/MobL family protein [Alphaproteobacteria bacterium]
MERAICRVFTLIDVPAEGRYNDLIIWFLNMAIFFARASFCSRSSGKGAVAQAAYRSGKAFKDNQRNRTFDYSKKTDRHDIHQNILLPIGAPEWMKNSERLWNHVQEFETNLIFKRYKGTHNDPIKREKSLAGRQKALGSAQDSWNQIIALPRELNQAQNIEMLEAYLQKRFVSRGLICDYSIHKDKGNWHAHVAVTLREILPTGNFSEKKITSYKGLESHKDPFCRQQYSETARVLADTMNNSLERAGVLDRVDHRSLEEQGIKRQATIHEGSYARLLEKSGEKSRRCQENRDRKAQDLALYLENPSYLLNDLARQSVVFTEAKIAETIFKLTDG